jgi:hypothetical protein
LDLIDKIASEAMSLAEQSRLPLHWEDSCEAPGFGRAIAILSLSEETFDCFFNGPSGYRAQYYLSPEEGVLFNHRLRQALRPAITCAYKDFPLNGGLRHVIASLQAAHAKFWVFAEQVAFNGSPEGAILPKRWVLENATKGKKAPLPAHCKIEFKGAFISADASTLFVDACKADRACELFRRGFT